MPIILCNAQPFGFGPSSILFTIYPWLRRLTLSSTEPLELHYIGSGLSLDIHKDVPWDQVHYCDIYSNSGVEKFAKICKELKPILFITTMDEDAAAVAQEIKIPVVIIDALLWFWRDLPSSWIKADRVIALDFFGVAKRIEGEGLKNIIRVPPTMSSPPESGQTKPLTSDILIILGGLENPYTDVSVNIAYAKLIVDAVDAAQKTLMVDGKWMADGNSLVILASKAVCRGLDDTRAITTSPGLARLYLHQSKCAFLTPGYSNIFDAAELASVASFLPPSNGTQALQINSIRNAGMAPHAIDWHEVLDISPIDYRGEDVEVLSKIAEARHSASASEKARLRLSDYCRSALMDEEGMQGTTTQPLSAIFQRFGRDDGRMIVEAISEVVPSMGLKND